jgi:hypothetical protein
MNIHEIEKNLMEQAQNVAENWFVNQSQNMHSKFYLYYRPAEENEKIGKLAVFSEDERPENSGWILARNEAFSRAWTKANARYQIFELSKKLPILNTNFD